MAGVDNIKERILQDAELKAKEIMDKYNKYGKEYFYLNRMFNEYRKVFDGVDI